MLKAGVLTVMMLFFVGLGSASAQTGQPLQTAIYPLPQEGTGPDADLYFERVRSAGATVTRLWLQWYSVAPAVRPAGFQPDDPGDPAYNWQAIDSQVTNAVRHGLEPLVTIYQAPPWAEAGGSDRPGITRPDPVELGLFAKAAAARYSGTFLALPRVRYWQAWNEPNLHISLNPQFVDGAPVSPDLYRQMLNDFAASVHSVHPDNLVVTGGLAPFYDSGVVGVNWGPLTFMRDLLCISKDLQPTCNTQVNFDVWADHPYTSGGPTHHARLPDDVSLGDLPEMQKVLQAAVQAGHVVSSAPPRFWVTEFSWDSNPPDPLGVPVDLETRWVAEGLYRMWQSGVSLVTWLQLRDAPYPADYYQSGLYFRGSAGLASDTPKPALTAFRFPFVAFPFGDVVSVWGRTPGGVQGQEAIEQDVGGTWNQLGILPTDVNGIFEGQLQGDPALGPVRARDVQTLDTSAPFSLWPVHDQYFNPFGLPFILEARPGPPLPASDLNGDGVSDRAVFRPADGNWYLNGDYPTSWGTGGDQPTPADFNGDGTADIAVYRPFDGFYWYVLGSPPVQWGDAGDVPTPADFDGDGKAEFAVFRPSTGVWYIRGGPTVQWGIAGDIPVPADYNGDGTADIAVYRPSDGFYWYVFGSPRVQWGGAGDIPVPADYNGDGRADIAVFRPSNGTWYIPGQAPVQWGAQGDIPVPGDFDGDGKADIAVFRPSDGFWYVLGSPRVFWGAPGDIPLALPSAIRQAFFP